MTNPFDAARDAERHHIWDRLVRADSEAFAAGDWSLIEHDFDADRFEGIRCNNSADPADWQITFARLSDYRDSWLSAAKDFAAQSFVGMSNLDAIYARCRLSRIEIAADRAIVVKEFSGVLKRTDGTTLSGRRQTLYRLHRIAGEWKIVGFLGFLPLDDP